MSLDLRPRKIRLGAAASSALFMLALALGACGGGNDGGNQNNGPETTTARVKNLPLNDCVSVMSGERPAVGVTIPRCVPTTLQGNPNKSKRG